MPEEAPGNSSISTLLEVMVLRMLWYLWWAKVLASETRFTTNSNKHYYYPFYYYSHDYYYHYYIDNNANDNYR